MTPTPESKEMTPESWEEEFRDKYEGANIGDTLSSRTIDDMIALLRQVEAAARQQGREEALKEKKCYEVSLICGCGVGHKLTIEDGFIIDDTLSISHADQPERK